MQHAKGVRYAEAPATAVASRHCLALRALRRSQASDIATIMAVTTAVATAVFPIPRFCFSGWTMLP